MLQKTWAVVPLTFQDCKKAADLHQKAFFKGWSEKNFQDFLENPLILGLKIEEEQKLIGYVLWREVKNEAEILTLLVAFPYQKQGKGSLLLEKLFEILKEKNIESVFLEVAEDNHLAQSFYIKRNFILLSIRPGYYPRKAQDAVSALNFFKTLV